MIALTGMTGMTGMTHCSVRSITAVGIVTSVLIGCAVAVVLVVRGDLVRGSNGLR